MRKFLISALVLSTVVGVATAAANHGGYHSDRGNRGQVAWNRGGPSRQAINELLRDLQRAENGIQRSIQRRVISQREAMGLRRQANRSADQPDADDGDLVERHRRWVSRREIEQ